MAKAAVAAVLQKTLGPFVDGIDAKSLELSVWDGDVKLDQLQLRTSALAALELPLRVVGARLGSVRVQIPWRNLGGEPMIVTVDRLFLVLAPKSTTAAYDASKEAAASDEAKRAQLAAWEAEQAAAAQVDASFAERLATRLLGKLVVNVTNVHVRVESGRDDGGASRSVPTQRPRRSHASPPAAIGAAAGFVLRELRIEDSAAAAAAAAAGGAATAVAERLLRKAASIKGAAAYLAVDEAPACLVAAAPPTTAEAWDALMLPMVRMRC